MLLNLRSFRLAYHQLLPISLSNLSASFQIKVPFMFSRVNRAFILNSTILTRSLSEMNIYSLKEMYDDNNASVD